jgi:hypothetical protein
LLAFLGENRRLAGVPAEKRKCKDMGRERKLFASLSSGKCKPWQALASLGKDMQGYASVCKAI